MSETYYVTGYAGSNHEAVRAGKMLYGDRLLTTRNDGPGSKDVEVSAWKSRMARGEVSRVIVVKDGIIIEKYP